MKFRVSISSLNPQLEHFGKRALLAPQVLKSYIGHKDPGIEIILNDFHENDQDGDIVSTITAQDVDLIAFSTYVWNIERVIDLCYGLKQKTDTLLVLGGPGASYTAEHILAIHGCVDVVVLGEGEEALSQLVQRLKRGSRQFNGIHNLAYRLGDECHRSAELTLPLEDHNYPLDSSDWQDCARICYETSRGCVMKCKFCLWYKGGTSKVRFYRMAKVKSDLARIFDLPNLRMLEFVDADINMNRSRAIEIFEHVRRLNDRREEEGLNRVFLLYESNPEMFNSQIIEEMTKHDRVIDFGLQTIDEELHHTIMGRVFHRERYFETLERLVSAPSDRYGEYMLEIIYGLPGDTLDGFKETIRFILSLPYLMNFWCFRFLMMPGTIFHQEAAKFGAEYNPEPPYELLSSNSWSGEDLDIAQFLSFHFCLVQYGLPDVFAAVRQQITHDRLGVFQVIFSNWAASYEEVRRLYRECRGPGREVYQFQRCTAFSCESQYDTLREKLTLDSQAIIGQDL